MRILLAFIIFVLAATAQALEQVEFSADRIHGLFVFVETIAGQPHRSPDVKRVFETSKYNNSKSKEKIEQFRSLDFVMAQSFIFEGFPSERNAGSSIRDSVITQTAFATDLNDFRQRVLGLLPIAELVKLIEVMKYFEPIYNELLWQKYLPEMQKAAREFKSKSAQWKLNDLFSRATKFYGAVWPADQQFRVSLFPIPPRSEHSNGQSYGAFESVGIVVGEVDREGRFGVIFHELCHSLYKSQTQAIQNMISAAFKTHDSKFANLAYGYFNEALATALGNGWAYEKAKGKVDPQDWYADDKIHGFARALYPKVVEYLNAKKTIDGEFVSHSVRTFEKEFPSALNEFQPAMTNIILATDGEINSRDLRLDLRKNFRINSISAISPINHPDTKTQVKSQNTTLFLISTHANRGQIDSLEEVFPGLAKAIGRQPMTGHYLALFDVGARKVIVLLVETPSIVPKAILLMSKGKRVEKLNSFIELKFQSP